MLVCIPFSAGADDSRYRVEVLVLRHLESSAEARELEWVRDYAAESLDLLNPKEDEGHEDDGDEDAVTGEESQIDIDGLEPGVDMEEQPVEEDPFADVVLVEAMSEVMQDAWRRLRLSAPFRPEQYLSWEQSGEEPFPALRVHNSEVIMTDDPFAEMRAAAEEARMEAEPIEFSDTQMPGEEEEEEFPEPTLYYQLDGTAMLRKTRFLHLDLDLEFREAVYDPESLQIALMRENEFANDRLTPAEPLIPVPSSFLVHQLKQSRQVKTMQMEYFDGPYMGVLVYLMPVEIVEVEGEEAN